MKRKWLTLQNCLWLSKSIKPYDAQWIIRLWQMSW